MYLDKNFEAPSEVREKLIEIHFSDSFYIIHKILTFNKCLVYENPDFFYNYVHLSRLIIQLDQVDTLYFVSVNSYKKKKNLKKKVKFRF